MTYICIDNDNMRVTHKHESRVVINALNWIECNCNTTVMQVGGCGLDDYTDTELMLLYENLTGSKLVTYANHMRQVVWDAIQRLPLNDVIHIEVHDQAKCIKKGDRGDYRYVKGSRIPEQVGGLLGGLRTVANKAAEDDKAFTAPPAPEPTDTPFIASAPAPFTVSTGVSTERVPRAPAAPRQGGTKGTVFEVADKMYEDAGRPTVQSDILKLRKQMMEVLESQHGIKRTTSSNTLGEWQKLRIA